VPAVIVTPDTNAEQPEKLEDDNNNNSQKESTDGTQSNAVVPEPLKLKPPSKRLLNKPPDSPVGFRIRPRSHQRFAKIHICVLLSL
jgi:hypothetical protein